MGVLFVLPGRQSFAGAALSLELLHGGVYAAFVNTEHNHRIADADTRSTVKPHKDDDARLWRAFRSDVVCSKDRRRPGPTARPRFAVVS
jgi:hypothetical protein